MGRAGLGEAWDEYARRQLAGAQSGEITSSQADVGCFLALMQRGM
jgi:hypothetical protein